MMTCVSERSGIASRGIVRTATTPPRISPNVARRTMNLFLREKSMRDLSMGGWRDCGLKAAAGREERSGQADTLFPLTPTLSLGERENRWQFSEFSGSFRI